MKIEVVRIVPTCHTIPVPFGMSVAESWERVQDGYRTKTLPFPEGTLIKGYCTILVMPGGRIVGITT